MNPIYFIIVTLSLYGDLFKRYIPAQAALGILYGLSIAILIWLLITNRHQKQRHTISSESKLLCASIYLLLIIYILHFLVGSGSAPWIAGSVYILYVFTPLMYPVIIISYCHNFNLNLFANIYHFLMIPINIVGLIQFKIDPSFLIDKTYSAAGGIVQRNLLEGSSFTRLPSIFVSSDRYSAIGLVQFYLAFVLMLDRSHRSSPAWIIFNLVGGCIAMFISGARSRLIIVVALMTILFIATLKSSLLGEGLSYLFKKIEVTIFSIKSLILMLVIVLLLFLYPELTSTIVLEISRFPIIGFLTDSFLKGDVQDRVGVTFDRSMIPDQTSWFGLGLGSLGDKPGEYSLAQTFAESGIFWGIFKLIGFIGIILALGLKVWKEIVRSQPLGVLTFGLPALAILTGLLTGLTGVLEISSGVMLTVTMGATMEYSDRKNNL